MKCKNNKIYYNVIKILGALNFSMFSAKTIEVNPKGLIYRHTRAGRCTLFV